MAATWSDTGTRSRRSVNATSEAAPTLATDGVNLSGVSRLTAFIYAPGGQTFTGVGTLLGYVYTGSQWVRLTEADLDLADASGLDSWGKSLTVISPRQRFALIPSSVGLSGGAQVTLDFFCVASNGEAV